MLGDEPQAQVRCLGHPAPYMKGRLVAAAGGLAVEAEFFEFAAQGVAMDAQHLGCAALVAVSAIHGGLEEFFLELLERLLEQNAAIDHL